MSEGVSPSRATELQQTSGAVLDISKLYAADARPLPPAFGEKEGMWGAGSGSADTSGYSGIARLVDLNGNTTPPFGGWFDQVAARMAQLVPGFCEAVQVWRDEITFYVKRDLLPQLARACRDDAALRFENCASLDAAHYPAQTGHELHVSYHLASYTHNRRIRLEVTLSEDDPHVPSVVDVYPMANFHEREAWDMFGIVFDGHPGLTRILMPDDWVGHPQRKDYPLGGIPVEYKGATVPPPDQRRSYQS